MKMTQVENLFIKISQAFENGLQNLSVCKYVLSCKWKYIFSMWQMVTGQTKASFCSLFNVLFCISQAEYHRDCNIITEPIDCIWIDLLQIPKDREASAKKRYLTPLVEKPLSVTRQFWSRGMAETERRNSTFFLDLWKPGHLLFTES